MHNLLVAGQLYSTVEGSLDEGLIMAYVDGELDQDGRNYVETLLAGNAEAREFADLLQLSSTLVRSAFVEEPETPAVRLSVVPTQGSGGTARTPVQRRRLRRNA
ncbi:anti-sigma factor family protein [Skermanella pratensis]|uniref:anti-sigma factor family protein n=1 Tax=Skermanella pratensis TaxID=2233999 RepID=UPI0013016407|nr:hypothetical protein [Skermanella pratensis]